MATHSVGKTADLLGHANTILKKISNHFDAKKDRKGKGSKGKKGSKGRKGSKGKKGPKGKKGSKGKNNPKGNNSPKGKNNPKGNEKLKKIPIAKVSKSTPIVTPKPPVDQNSGTATINALPTNTATTLNQSSTRQNKLLSAGSISVIVILLGIFVFIGFIFCRKRSKSRRGAVRLSDSPDKNLSMKQRYVGPIRIPSLPPTVQLPRLSSASIALPFKGNRDHIEPLNNNFRDKVYLSPYTITHDLSGPGYSNESALNDFNDCESQKRDSASSRESYSELEGSFPMPPQRNSEDRNSATPTNSTFGDIYNYNHI